MTGKWHLTLAEDPADGRIGEDRWVFYEHDDGTAWAAVIDGASSETREPPTGGDYADALKAGLLQEVRARPLASPTEALRAAIEFAVPGLQLPQPSAPSAAVSLARWDADGVTVATLGDVFFAAFAEQDLTLRDGRLGNVGKEHRTAYKRALAEGRGYGPDHDRVMRQLRGVERVARNHTEGYWIAADVPDAATHAVTAHVDAPVEAILLASDGATAGVTKYGLWPNWAALRSAIEHDPQEVVGRIRAAERGDPEGTRWPRSKIHDDLVALVLRNPEQTPR